MRKAKKGRNFRPFSVLRVAITTILIPAVMVAAGGRELPGGEGDPGEHLAGIFRKTGIVTAFLGRDGIFQNRYNQLGIPFQTNDGKLAQGHIEPPMVAVRYQFLVEHLLDALGDLDHRLVMAIVTFPDFGTQNHWVQNFHH